MTNVGCGMSSSCAPLTLTDSITCSPADGIYDRNVPGKQIVMSYSCRGKEEGTVQRGQNLTYIFGIRNNMYGMYAITHGNNNNKSVHKYPPNSHFII